MINKELTFNDLPQVVAELRDEVSCMKAILLNLQNRSNQQRENRHRPVTPEQVAEYTNIPLATIYQKLANREIPGSKPGKRWVIYLDEIDKWLEANRKNPIPLTDEEQNAAILASHKRKPNKSSWQTDPIVEPSKKVNVANATTSKPKVIAETDMTPPTADAANDVVVSDDSEQSNDGIHSTESDNATSIDGINASDVTSSFDRLKVIYKKVGNNESQAFGVWQQLSESERTAAFAHTQRLQGDLSLRSYLYVYLRDKEWMKAM
jgi:excisionase family DNA binding protein